MHIPAKDLSLLLCRIDRQGVVPLRFKISLTVRASAKPSFYSDFLQRPVRKGAVFWTKKKSVISWSHWQPSWDLATLTTHHIHTISPISLTIFSLSRRLRTVVGQSPNIHTKLMGSWRGHRNHRSLLCLDWTHSLWTSCTLQNPILELGPNSSSRRGGRMWCGILWLRKERVEWGWCVVRPSKSFIQSPTLWAWPGKFIGGLKVMQSAVTNTVFVFST